MNEKKDGTVVLVGLLLLAVGIALLVDTCHCGAQDVLAEVPDVSLPDVGETAALERGDRAPWAGMLVRDEDLFGLQTATMVARFELEQARRLTEEAIAGRDRLLLEATRACDERVALHDALWTERRDALAAALLEARGREGPAWYEHPAIWFAVGAILAGALGLGVAAVVGG